MPPAMAFCASVSAARLLLARHRDGPMIVDDDEHHRQPPDAGEIHRFVKVALRGGAVPHHGDGDAALLAQFERRRDAHRMRGLARDRHGRREILPWDLVVAAALVAAPELQELRQRHAAPDLRRLFAIGDRHHVGWNHRSRIADADGLLPGAGGIGAELAGALQRDRLGIEDAGQRHRAIEADHGVAVPRESRRFGDERGARIEILPEVNLERGHESIAAGIWRSLGARFGSG